MKMLQMDSLKMFMFIQCSFVMCFKCYIKMNLIIATKPSFVYFSFPLVVFLPVCS